MEESMERYLVRTIEQKEIKNRRITVQAPGSKSITNRALLLATLADGRSTLYGALFSDDSRAFLDCVQRLGFSVEANEEARMISVVGNRFRIPKEEVQINVGSAGTAARFLTALLGISAGVWQLDASEQMKKRPMAPLLSCLRELGTEIIYLEQEEHFPFILHSSGVTGREITINIDDSSQFLSAMLISCCRTGEDFIIHVTGSHGMAYIDITTKMMEEFGVRAIRQDTAGGIDYLVPGGQSYHAREYRIEPDVSAACYFYAMAMLLGVSVTVKGVRRDTRQGDIALLRVLEQMGGVLREEENGDLT
ncbi:MAG: 3-phosphoshikimate 1-carboxyvinyltransferase, partial [Lachnospiraceae bacterium]|nr:3-phosphoshikimate 1-carboxyvinyltransferase [Lachnospiraceae bacterium]